MEGRICDLIVSVPDHCLSLNSILKCLYLLFLNKYVFIFRNENKINAYVEMKKENKNITKMLFNFKMKQKESKINLFTIFKIFIYSLQFYTEIHKRFKEI